MILPAAVEDGWPLLILHRCEQSLRAKAASSLRGIDNTNINFSEIKKGRLIVPFLFLLSLRSFFDHERRFGLLFSVLLRHLIKSEHTLLTSGDLLYLLVLRFFQ